MNRTYSYLKQSSLWLTIVLLTLVAGCNSSGDPILSKGGDTTGVAITSVTAVTPLKDAMNVPVNTQTITASFSKEMDPASITATSFILQQGAVTVAGGTVTYVAAGSIATLTLPIGNLLSNTLYTATVTQIASGLDGVTLATDFVWTFTTGAVVDITPPTVISTAAYGITGDTSGGINFPLNRSSTATFSESMDQLSLITPPAFTLMNDNLGTAVLGSVTYDVASKTLSFKPDIDLDPLTLYIATISIAAKDLAGNALAANYVWEWTTGNIADTTRPTVTTTAPLDGALNVFIDQTVNATFSEDMDAATITDLSFTLTDAGLIAVDGLVTYNALTRIATLDPLVDLAPSTTYTATVTTVAADIAGNELEGNQLPIPPAASDYQWRFTTGAVILPAANLGAAATFGMAATKGVTNAGATLINGDVVLNPDDTCNAVPVDNAGGFGLCGGFAPSIDGEVITLTYPDLVTAQAVTDALRAAYLEITPANMPGATPIAAPTTLGAPIGDALVEGDNLFYPGVYQSGTSILISGDLTLDAQGDANASFVFQAGSTVGTTPNTRILLVNGAKSSNVWWQAGSDATLQTNTTWHGNILAYRDITMVTDTTSCGRLFAGAFTDGAFVFDANTVSVPGHANAPVGCE